MVKRRYNKKIRKEVQENKYWKIIVDIATIAIAGGMLYNAYLLYDINEDVAKYNEANLQPQLFVNLDTLETFESRENEVEINNIIEDILDSMDIHYSWINSGETVAVNAYVIKPRLFCDNASNIILPVPPKSDVYTFILPKKDIKRACKLSGDEKAFKKLERKKTVYLYFAVFYEDLKEKKYLSIFIKGIKIKEDSKGIYVEHYDEKHKIIKFESELDSTVTISWDS